MWRRRRRWRRWRRRQRLSFATASKCHGIWSESFIIAIIQSCCCACILELPRCHQTGLSSLWMLGFHSTRHKTIALAQCPGKICNKLQNYCIGWHSNRAQKIFYWFFIDSQMPSIDCNWQCDEMNINRHKSIARATLDISCEFYSTRCANRKKPEKSLCVCCLRHCKHQVVKPNYNKIETSRGRSDDDWYEINDSINRC